jgi:hypothetical protein
VKYRNLTSIALSFSIFALTTAAHGQGIQIPPQVDSRPPKIVHFNGSIEGDAATAVGACSIGYGDQCPSGHICNCLSAIDLKFSGAQLGKGTASIFFTIDLTEAYGSLGGGSGCAPLVGEIDVTASKDSLKFAASGGNCFGPDGSNLMVGIMGIEASQKFVASGYASFSADVESAGLSGARGFCVCASRVWRNNRCRLDSAVAAGKPTASGERHYQSVHSFWSPEAHRL